jgi:hypothetical protein
MRRVAKSATGVAGIVCPIAGAHRDAQGRAYILYALLWKNTRGHSPQQPDPALGGGTPDDTDIV